MRADELVLADRRQIIMRNIEHAYPVTRKTQMTYSGSGYGAGYTQGQQADIGASAGCAGEPGARSPVPANPVPVNPLPVNPVPANPVAASPVA